MTLVSKKDWNQKCGVKKMMRISFHYAHPTGFHSWFECYKVLKSCKIYARSFSMALSLLTVQWRDGTFWNSEETFRNDHSVLTTVSFSEKFEFFHFRNRRQDHSLLRWHIPRKKFLGRDVQLALGDTF